MWTTANLLELDRATTRLASAWWPFSGWGMRSGDEPAEPTPTAKMVDPVVSVDIPCRKKANSFTELTTVPASDEWVYRLDIIESTTVIHVSNVTVGSVPVSNNGWNYVVLRFKTTDQYPVMVLGLDKTYACRFKYLRAEFNFHNSKKDSPTQIKQIDWNDLANNRIHITAAGILQSNVRKKSSAPINPNLRGSVSQHKGETEEGTRLDEFVLNGALCSTTLLFDDFRLTLHFTLDQQ